MNFINKKFLKIKKINRINVKNGDVFKFLDRKSNFYSKFGEIYFSKIKYNKIKCWKLHTKMTMNITVPIGKVKFVFVNLENNLIDTCIIGENNYYILQVLPGILFGFKGISKKENLIANFSNIKFQNNESKNFDKNFYNYNW